MRAPRSTRTSAWAATRKTARGKDKLGANLVDSPFVNAADPSASIRILVGGKEGPIGLMPPLGPALSDEQIAAALTYIRRAWGHTAAAGRSAERHGSARPVEGPHQAVDRSGTAGRRARRPRRRWACDGPSLRA